jgi:ribonuclease J
VEGINVVSVTVYGGAGEIGGNKILVKDKDTNVFLDFGKNYKKEGKFYDPPFLQARCTEHLLGLKILPDIKGIYKYRETIVKPEINIDGVLISHPHGDHYDYVRFLKDDIPIHCGEGTKEIITARECSGTKGPTAEYYISNFTKSKGYQEFKSFNTFHTGDEPKVGNIKYRPIHVDHSVCGAYGYILETSGGVIGYSGDVRMHGPKHSMTKDFVNALKKSQPELLLIEGTNIDSSRLSSEIEVKNKAKNVVENTNGLVMAGFSVVDFDRFRTFYWIAKETGRQFVISMKQAYILNKIQPFIDIPKVTDKNITIFMKDKKSMGFENEVVDISGINIIHADVVNKNQKNILMVAGFYDFNELIKIDPVAGSSYILSQSEPFNEEMEIDHAKLLNWLELHGMPLFSIHASGHANANELKEIITEVKPKKVCIIHSERPELFKRYISDLKIETIVPQEGSTITL